MGCRHTTRFILIYIIFLPVALWRHLGYVSLIAGPLLALLLCGIENIGARLAHCVSGKQEAGW